MKTQGVFGGVLIVIAVAWSFAVSGCNAVSDDEDKHALAAQVLTSNGQADIPCTTNEDCGGSVCVMPGMWLGPTGRCFDDNYVWCSTWPTPAFAESNEPGSAWACDEGEIFALCQPESSEAIDSFCRPAKEYNSRTEYYRYSCCSPKMFE